MKRVYTNSDQVLHLWANQSQSDARCSNVFFEGKSCYSYGYHYELGRIIKYKGQTVVMINNAGYSVTTAKHIGNAINAVSHMPYLTTKGDMTDVRGALVGMQGDLIETIFDHFARRSMRYASIWSEYKAENVKDFNVLCELLGHKELKLDINIEFIELYNEHITKCQDRQKQLESPENLAKKELRRTKSEAKYREKIQDEIKAWRIGGPLTNAVRAVKPQIIRVMTRIDSGEREITTSLGATVPYREASSLLDKLVNTGSAPKGFKIGDFKFDSISNGIVKIGCHSIDLNDAKQVFENL